MLQEARTQGRYVLHDKLRRIDPESAERLHPHDEVKIVRALEVHHLSGRRLSEMQRQHRFSEQPFSLLMIGLIRDRECRYHRIDERVDEMFQRGVVEETAQLLAKGYGRELGAMKGLGYCQIAGYLAGEYDQAEARRLLKRDTRHFAKRQLTWFRKEPGLHWWSLNTRTAWISWLGTSSKRFRRLWKSYITGAGGRIANAAHNGNGIDCMKGSKKTAQPAIGIIGGSGLYNIDGLEKVREVRVRTPFGAPSDALIIGTLGAVRVAFLSRHRRGHRNDPAASITGRTSMR